MRNLALSGVTGFSIRPLRLSLFAGLTIALLAAIYGIYAIAMAVFTNETVTGWTSVIVSILFLSGIQLIVLGIMGEYIGKLFMEIKRRPHYVIGENSQQLQVQSLRFESLNEKQKNKK
jgi:dolichol-phosphate mannosyltransferase